jgi:predicted 3-demethylubiquinone-9 3-methyltransferase (glyoxalase superfamily)
MTAPAQKITPFLMFTGAAEEAVTFYTSLFDDGEILEIERCGPGEPGAEGSVRQARMVVAGQQVICVDSAMSHDFTFTPSVSLFVRCDSADEQERLWKALADGGTPLMPLGDYGFGSFGWTNDRSGVSWQLALA